jgi:hypothetical protein
MILNTLEVNFGPKVHLDEAYVFNPRGSWEHTAIRKINEEIFSRLGGDWDRPPVFESGWQDTPEFYDLKERARKVVQEDFGAADIWGFKCPMTCMTLPFWQEVLPSMHYVICLRNPLDVARSLERRDDFPLEKGLHLWLVYTKFALKHTQAHRRLFLHTDAWTSAWKDMLERISDFIQLPRTTEQFDVQADSIRELIDEALFDSTSWPALCSTQGIYQACADRARTDPTGLDRDIEASLALVRMEADNKQSWKLRSDSRRWWLQKLRTATKELNELVPVGDSIILVDEDRVRSQLAPSRTTVPFLERGGNYWGPPQDDATAIEEFERLRETGVSYIVFAWPAFWWLEYYSRWNTYLRSHFPCVMQNNRLIVFRVQP